MRRKLLSALIVLFVPVCVFAEGTLNLPFSLPPERYGNVLMNLAPRERSMAPVDFPHWIHRTKFTCRVCHYELEFSMKANDTPILCDEGRMNGRYCAVCHNGKTSFAPVDAEGRNCNKCHSGGSTNMKKFNELTGILPHDRYGNGIDWAKALNKGLISPKDSLTDKKRELVNVKTLTLRAEMSGISPAIFPHKTHEQWLDCSSCHPELFNLKKKSTASLRMNTIIMGESCGLCHLSVAFPLDDCKRCHPGMKIR